jgi:hypothetical protein
MVGLATIHAKERIAFEQGRIIQGRLIILPGFPQTVAVSVCRNDGIDFNDTASPGKRADTASYPV